MPKVWKPSVYAGSQTFFRLRDIIMTVFLGIGAYLAPESHIAHLTDLCYNFPMEECP